MRHLVAGQTQVVASKNRMKEKMYFTLKSNNLYYVFFFKMCRKLYNQHTRKNEMFCME